MISVQTVTRCICCLIIAIAVLVSPSLGAHEIGKTQVSATFRSDGTYQLDVVVDPDALLTKLEVYAAHNVSTGLNQAARDKQIVTLAQVFTDRVRLRFDDVVATPHFEYLPASRLSDIAQAPSIVRLTGRVPAGVRQLSFANGMALGSYALNVRIGDSPIETFWLDGPRPSPAISLVAPPAPASSTAVAWQYLRLGFRHIVPQGLDHVLFVLGIFLLSGRWRSILLQVSTFTVAHSITLGLTMYGIVSLPARVVEPMIAVSIAYVAVENLVTSELKPWRLALVFSFGLLHGMGFAGVLRDLGLPRSQFLTALVTFNAGVEAGQLTVIGLAFVAVAYWHHNRAAYRRYIVQPASLTIALVGLYWTAQRVLG